MNPDLFFEVTDWGGHFGSIWWLNSEPSPSQEPFFGQWVTFWGCIIWGKPEPYGHHGTVVPLRPWDLE